jgi:fatty acid desaturase
MTSAMTATMVPTDLPDTLPTARLTTTGRPVADVRASLRRIPGPRNALTVFGAWAQIAIVIGGAVWIDRWWAWPIAVLLMGRNFALLLILAHEAAHRLLFQTKAINDGVGKWLLGYPGFVPFDLYRRSHMAHHKDEMGPEEPDIPLYAGYPITRASLRRKLTRDAVGISGWKNLKPLLRALRTRVAQQIVLTQVVILALSWIAGWPQLYLVLWLIPWLTSWRVINRLRSIAEHGGMIRSSDKRETTHNVRQHLVARFWMVPYNTGYHLAHHVDSGIPWRALPRLQHELQDAAWAPVASEWPSYTALWRALSSS